jgi:hypothetical protein
VGLKAAVLPWFRRNGPTFPPMGGLRYGIGREREKGNMKRGERLLEEGGKKRGKDRLHVACD